MQVSTKLFNQQQLQQFSSTTEELQNLQNKISSGQNILKASETRDQYFRIGIWIILKRIFSNE